MRQVQLVSVTTYFVLIGYRTKSLSSEHVYIPVLLFTLEFAIFSSRTGVQFSSSDMNEALVRPIEEV